jgi:predicted transcriptional regulator YdeE
MNTQAISPFTIAGIAVRTTNENGQSGIDIPLLWNKFMLQKIQEKIPNKIDHNIYCVYTNYEKDHTRPYTTLLGCRVANLETIPEDMVGQSFNGGKYHQHIAKGNLSEGAVFHAWTAIWRMDIERAYTADFEVYGEKAQDPANAEVEIFIAVK